MGILSAFADGEGERNRLSGEDSADARGRALDESVIYEIISNERRRYALQVLQSANREVYLRELAERVAAREHDKPIDELTTGERRSVETALRQFHLPKMADADFIEYDKRRKTTKLVVPSCVLSEYLGPTVQNQLPRRVLLSAAGGVAMSGYLLLLLVEFGVPEPALAATPLLLAIAMFLLGGAWLSRTAPPSPASP